ncbi:MAG: serine hydrolase [Saprospiraceae bacterium]|nr:serine hydrolase [Saprospiraceae bacterium]
MLFHTDFNPGNTNQVTNVMVNIRMISFSIIFCTCILNIFGQTTKEIPIKTVAQLQDTINKILINDHQSSLMLAVVTEDSILLSNGFRFANIDTQHKANSQTLFPMASITKTFTALAIMKLIKQGKISLYDNLSIIAPEIVFINKWEKTNPLKIVHLLEHTSGFDDLRFNTFWNKDLNITELQSIEKCKNSMHCRWRPGEREAYCNVDYIILGYLIEKLSGLKYEAFLQKEILLPIGMTNSNFIVPTQPNSNYADPYNWNGTHFERLPHLQFYGKGAGALYSCADDMAKFIQFMINNGNNDDLNSLKNIVENMEIPESTPASKLGLKTGYAKGITIDYLSYKFPFYGHGGTSIGFFSRYAYNRDLKVGFVVCGTNPNQISDLLIHFLTDSLEYPKPIPTIKVDNEILKSYEGYYQLQSPRFEIIDKYLEELLHGYHIRVIGDSLHSFGFKRPDQVLLPVTASIFKRQNENSPSFIFTTNSEGEKVLYEWGAYYEKTSYTKILVTQILVLGGLVCGILLLLSSIFWLFKSMLNKLPWNEYFKRSLSSFGVLSLIIAFGALAYMSTNVSLMGTRNFFTITFYIGTIMFAILTVTGFIITIKRCGLITNKWTKWYLVVTTTWLLALVVFYFHYDWIGLKMWSY